MLLIIQRREDCQEGCKYGQQSTVSDPQFGCILPDKSEMLIVGKPVVAK